LFRLLDYSVNTSRTDSYEGLHVLLVTEDDARAQPLAKALRERKAHVGDVRAGAKDPVALRGADLLVIDARRAASTEARVTEVRSDVRARWASVATIDYATLVNEDGSVDLRNLDGIVARLAGMDKALTERARKEKSFEATLAPLGPTRTLRALALAGPTLHVELNDGTLKASVDLADELLVAAFAERDGQRSEAWLALARVLGMTDATVTVEQRAHPAAMNIMEPVDQALESAAQERARTPELFASEERTEELSGLRRELRDHTAVSASQAPQREPLAAAQAQGAAASNGSKSMPPRARTLVGVAPVPTPAPSSAPANGVKPIAPRPSAPAERFADVPTNPAAPGLLQSMAKAPANDAGARPSPAVILSATPSLASTTPTAPPPPMSAGQREEPVLSVSRSTHDDDDDYDGEGQEYDAGEVTVVADASQLDVLRETLGRLEAPKKPLTSTMPAPPGPDTGELENVESSDEPVLELSASSGKSAAESVFGADELPTGEVPSEQPPPAAPLAAPRAPQLESAQKTEGKQLKSETRSSPLWLVALLLVVAAVVLFALYGKGTRSSSPASDAPAAEERE